RTNSRVIASSFSSRGVFAMLRNYHKPARPRLAGGRPKNPYGRVRLALTAQGVAPMSSMYRNSHPYVRVPCYAISQAMAANVRLPMLAQTPPDSPSGHALPDANAHGENGAHDDALGEDAELMQVGDLAKEAGKTVRAIHLYEELNLLKPAARSKGRY